MHTAAANAPAGQNGTGPSVRTQAACDDERSMLDKHAEGQAEDTERGRMLSFIASLLDTIFVFICSFLS